MFIYGVYCSFSRAALTSNADGTLDKVGKYVRIATPSTDEIPFFVAIVFKWCEYSQGKRTALVVIVTTPWRNVCTVGLRIPRQCDIEVATIKLPPHRMVEQQALLAMMSIGDDAAVRGVTMCALT